MSDLYRVVREVSIDKLQAAVSALMVDGWQPTGSPSWNERGLTWVQAVVRGPQPANGDVRLKEPKRR